MINITTLVKYIEGFKHIDFVIHQREEALIEREYRQTPQGWFKPDGSHIHKTAEGAIEKLGLSTSYKQLNPSDFYLLEEGEIPDDNIFITVDLHGVTIVGVFNE